MKLPVSTLLLALTLSQLACAQTQNVFKCQGAGGIDYRDTPCEANTGPAKSGAGTAVNRSANDNLTRAPLSAKVLYVGMTDTQVLNLPSCGRPARIARSREMNQWRERWTYQDRSTGKDRRVLYFENGRLVAQEYLAPALAMQTPEIDEDRQFDDAHAQSSDRNRPLESRPAAINTGFIYDR